MCVCVCACVCVCEICECMCVFMQRVKHSRFAELIEKASTEEKRYSSGMDIEQVGLVILFQSFLSQ